MTRLLITLFLIVCSSGAAKPAAQSDVAGAIVYTTMKNDGAFNELASAGTRRATSDLGLDIKEWVSADTAETEKVLRLFAEQGAKHILTMGFENAGAVRAAATAFPDVKFTIIDGYIADMPNVRSILFAEDEGGFLVGYVAGLKTETGTVGTLGALDIPPVRRFMCGFAAGVHHANPEAVILSGFVGDDVAAFRNLRGGRKMAAKMYQNGADIVFAPAGFAAEGAALAATDARKKVIMVDSNQNALAPGTVLTSAVKRIDEAVYATWKAVAQNTWSSGIVTMTTDDNGVDWAVDSNNWTLVEDIVPKVDEVKLGLALEKIEITVPDSVDGCADVL
ncbi:basic membrane protein A [Roseibium hamelinense]|uniref:Basic membrane protein A n=1 Tax=Roseibium hamelinense TaxID=150831 RepID=A0A562T7C7_9HYPH|nr:BMP family ABC transporter substrate-binding protein [Roseibium hamelinense]MTI42841.1 BMP family ABC transporter substrate-binding protein [Roseibium hamelinense]TWI89509.1 basic membrane protein A [Roseibium hamelinense]